MESHGFSLSRSLVEGTSGLQSNSIHRSIACMERSEWYNRLCCGGHVAVAVAVDFRWRRPSERERRRCKVSPFSTTDAAKQPACRPVRPVSRIQSKLKQSSVVASGDVRKREG